MPAHSLSLARRNILRLKCRATIVLCGVGVSYWRLFELLFGSSKKNALSATRVRQKTFERSSALLQRADDSRAALELLAHSKSPLFHL